MYNFLYCFDSNYNVQAAVSIHSILEKLNENINVYIIHDKPKTFEKFVTKLKKHKNLNHIETFEFMEINYDFPNLGDVHVTYATYFRMFIDKYLPRNLEYFIYVDADIVCLKDPKNELDKIFNTLKVTGQPLAGLTEGTRATSSLFDTLALTGEKYFNAGLIIVDYKEWLKNNTGEKLIDLMSKNYNNIKYWDQDVMNIYFDGKYAELPRTMNFTSSDGINLPDEPIYFLHYAGSKKPWYFKFVFNEISQNYHKAYKSLFNNKYHVTLKFKKHEIKDIISIFVSSKIGIFDKLKFFYSVIKSNFWY